MLIVYSILIMQLMIKLLDRFLGKGFSFSENDNAWHHSVMTKNIYEKAKEELKNGS